LPRPKLALLIREHGLQLDGAGGAIDGVVDKTELAKRRLASIVGYLGLDCQGRPGHGFADIPELIFGNRKRHVSRENLVDRDHGCVGLRLDERAGLHLQASGAAVDGRADLTVLEVQPGCLDRGFVGGCGGAGAFNRGLVGARGLIGAAGGRPHLVVLFF